MSKVVSTVATSLFVLLLQAGETTAQAPLDGATPHSVRSEIGPSYDINPNVDEETSIEHKQPSSLGRVPWTLVIEAVRTAKGDLIPWERDSEWARMWRVPGEIAETRYIPVEGDAEDRERVKPAETKSNESIPSGLAFLAGKYRAPAIALVVREPDAVAVIGWRNGSFGAWSRTATPPGSPPEDAKAEALRLIARTFSAGKKIVTAAGIQATVLAFREAQAGVQYQVVVQGRIEQQQLQRLLEKVGGLSIAEIARTSTGFNVVLNDLSGISEPIERRLTRAGLPTAVGSQQPAPGQ